MSAPEPEHAAWDLWRATTLMGRRLAATLEQRLQESASISVPDFEVLDTLSRAPEGRLRAGELSELLAWERSRTSHHVARMEGRELVERTACPADHRGTHVQLTARGSAALAEARPVAIRTMRETMLDGLSSTQAAALADAALRVLDGDPQAAVSAEVARLRATRVATASGTYA